VPENRTYSAELFSQELHSCQRLRSIEISPVMQQRCLRIAERHPVMMFTALAVTPQLVASAVNIAYNLVNTRAMSASISQAFGKVTIGYNVIVWPVCLAIVTFVARRSLNSIRMEPCETEEDELVQRHALIGLPDRMLTIAALGWLPGLVVFPIGMWILADMGSVEAFFRFALNILTSTLLAMVWSYLGLTWLVVSVCWPRHWLFPRRFEPQVTACELGRFSNGVRQARIASAAVPLLSCLLLVASSDQPGVQYDRFRLLVMLLLALGMTGPLIANRLAFQVQERVRIYSTD